MRNWIKICKEDNALAGWIAFVVSLGLIIASFIIPPTGIIDASVLAAVGELIGFAVIFKIPAMIRSIKDGKALSLKKGDFEVEVSSEKGKEVEE